MNALHSTHAPLTPCSAYHEPQAQDCICHPMGSLAELPFLHTIVDTGSQTYVAYLVILACQILYTGYRLLPAFLCRPLYVLSTRVDSLCFLMACYVEHAFPRASHFIWGRAGRAPEACCERLQRSLTQESSVTADSSPPSSAATIVCGTSEGKNKASEFRGSHAKLEPERNFAVGAGRLGSTAPQYSETYDALVEDRCGLQHEANRFPCTNEKTPQLALGSIDAATYYPDEDEGYTSATIVEELHSPAFIRAIHRSPDMAAIRRILESGEPVDDNESTRPPLIARLATTPSHSSHSSPMLSISRRQPGWHGPSSSSSAQTLDDVPRNCRKSQPKGEAKYTVKSSAAAAARARRHLLRPCASCAREAGLRRKKMELVIKEGWNNVEH